MARRRSAAAPTDDAMALQLGRTGPSGTFTYDWIRLAVSNDADSLYGKLRMHLNRDNGNVVYPSKERLAVMMHVARGDYIDRWLDELAAIGAVEVIPGQGMSLHNRYILHELPPDGYTGPMNQKEWNDQFKPLIELRKQFARDKTRLQRARKLYYLHETRPATLPRWFVDSGMVPATDEEWAAEHRAEVDRRAEVQAKRAAKLAGEDSPDPVTDENRKPSVTDVRGEPVTDQDGERVTDENRVELLVVDLGLDEVHPPTPAQARGSLPKQPTPQPPPCGRAHGPEVPCRACRTNPRAVAAAAKPTRPPWCGRCDQSTRRFMPEDGPVYRCPECHPLAAVPAGAR